VAVFVQFKIFASRLAATGERPQRVPRLAARPLWIATGKRTAMIGYLSGQVVRHW
jgi:hypothetical protein